ncbi:MAG: SPOR domain-containing protein [Phycisphaeraceae bacterium]
MASLWILLLAGLLAAGCEATPTAADGPGYGELYRQGDHARAYQAAAEAAAWSSGRSRDTANYVAGLSAHHLGRLDTAERHLREALGTSDDSLRGDVRAELGLVQHARGNYAQAAAELEEAADQLEGNDKAQAHLFAAISLQKLGRWSSARTHLLLGRASASDPTLRSRIREQLDVTGYTLQLGAFRDRRNARRLAAEVASTVQRLRLGPPRLVTRDGLTIVQVGQFTRFETARRMKDRLGRQQAIIVPLAGR